MKFTKKTDYALRIMQTLGRNLNQGPISIASMIKDTDMTLKFVQNVARDLSRKNLIKTKSGPNGGLSLINRPSQISVLEIIEAVEGKINVMDCLEHPSICSDNESCSIMSVLHTAQNAMVEKLRSTSLHLMIAAQKDPFNNVPRANFQNPVNHCPAVKLVVS